MDVATAALLAFAASMLLAAQVVKRHASRFHWF